jgi:cytochrome c553
MKTIACALALALAPMLALAAEKPDWAFPVTEKEQPAPRIPGDKARTVGNVTVTRAGADDFFNIPNWRPDMYPAMPKIVQFGNKDTQVRACGSCHLPTGTGHDESAYVAGLTQRYFTQQMADWKSGDRKFGATMIAMAKVITDAEVKEAADYFAALKPRPWIKVVEADTVPKSFVGPGNKRLVHPAGGTEALGNRIIEALHHVPWHDAQGAWRLAGAGGPPSELHRAPALEHAERRSRRGRDGADEAGGR